MTPNRLDVLHLTGGPHARGRAHGEALRGRIATLLDLWGEALERTYAIGRDRYVARFRAETRFEAALARWAPAVLDEVRGIAEGANADYPALLAFQHINEEFEFAPRFAARSAPDDAEACSTIVAPALAGRPALLAQNLDLAQFFDGHQILLRGPCDRSAAEIMALTVPGMISMMGMNSHGFAVCDNTLTQLRTNPDGVPIFALYRMLLECRSLAEAVRLVEETPHAVGLNWVMGDAGGVAMIERSADHAIPYRPNGDGLAYHTNHPLVSGDWAASFGTGAPAPRPSRSSYLRLAALHQRLQPAAEISVAALKTVLASRDDADYPVSRGGGVNLEDQQIGFTLACNIFELQAGDPVWHLAAGPPHERPFHIYRFD